LLSFLALLPFFFFDSFGIYRVLEVALSRGPKMAMWAEIPNYERHVFLPISRNDKKNLRADSDEKELVSNLRLMTFDEESFEPQFGLREEDFNNEIRIPDLTLVEDELARLSEEDSPEPSPTTFSALRCPAPTPESMRKGKTKTEEESDFADTEQNGPSITTTKPKQPLARTKVKSNKHKGSSTKQSPKDKHPRSSRPEGMPPLNLEGVDRQVEAVPSSPRLLSPRVQKPPSPGSSDTIALRPDQSRAVPSIQSPRSAFSITIK